MKVIILGNAGAGKSTLSRKLIARHPAARLSLDEVAFHGGTERRPPQDSVEDVKRWIADNESWIIEGCYSDIIEPLLAFCDELIFLNPGFTHPSTAIRASSSSQTSALPNNNSADNNRL